VTCRPEGVAKHRCRGQTEPGKNHYSRLRQITVKEQ